MAELNPKRARFVAEYLVDLNGTQAAIRAGYSPKTARQQADQLLSKLDVKEAVAKAQADKAIEVGRTAQDVLNDIMECTTQAREDGDLKTALKGLELQGKHLGMFTDKVSLSGALAFHGTIEVVKSGDS